MQVCAGRYQEVCTFHQLAGAESYRYENNISALPQLLLDPHL